MRQALSILGVPTLLALQLSALSACGGKVSSSDSRESESSATDPAPHSLADDRPMHTAAGSPLLVAEGEIGPTSIVSDETRVFWTTEGSTLLHQPTANGTLMMRYKQGGEKLMLALDSRGATYRTLVRAGNTLVWSTSDGRILSLGREGGTPTEVVYVGSEVRALSVDRGELYFVSERGDLGRVSLTGGSAEILSTGLVSPKALASDAWYIYVTVGREFNADVVRVPKFGGVSNVLMSGLTTPCGLAIERGEAFVVDRGAEALVSFSLVDGKAVSFASRVAGCSLGVDARFLYWMKRDADRTLVVRTERANGSEEVLGKEGVDGPIHVDDGGLYWATRSAIYSLEK